MMKTVISVGLGRLAVPEEEEGPRRVRRTQGGRRPTLPPALLH